MRKIMHCVLTAAAVALVPTSANAAVLVSIQQSGADVVATLSGTLSLSGLTLLGVNNSNGPVIRATPAFIQFAPSTVEGDVYSGFTGPANIGSGVNQIVGTGSSGNSAFAFSTAGSTRIFIGSNFVSGSALQGTITWAGTTISALGLATGVYTYVSSADSITVNIGNAPVPEPATWMLMLGGFSLLGTSLRRRRNKADMTVTVATPVLS